MLLKRIYKKDKLGIVTGEVIGVDLLKLPKSGMQRFSHKLVIQGIQQGWLKETKKHLTLRCSNTGHKKFKILSRIRRECLHCGKELPSIYEDPTGMAARAHVLDVHQKKEPPNGGHPCGYMVQNYYETKLEAKSWLTKYLTSH